MIEASRRGLFVDRLAWWYSPSSFYSNVEESVGGVNKSTIDNVKKAVPSAFHRSVE